MIPEINLLSNNKNRSNEKISKLFTILLVIWVGLFVVVIVQYFMIKNDQEEYKSQISRLTLQKSELETQLGNQNSQDAVSLEEAVLYVKQLDIPTSYVLAELTDLLPEASQLTSYSYTNGEASIQTQFTSLDSIANYVINLEGSKLLTDIKIDSVSMSDQTNGSSYVASFSIMINSSALQKNGGVESE